MPSAERLTTGNAELDSILGGGFPENSLNIVMGSPGSGKTVLAEHMIFANAATGGRPVLYLTTVAEPLEKIVHYLQGFDFYDETLLGGPIVYDSLGEDLVERGIAALIPRLEDAIKTIAPKIIVIDSFKALHDLARSTDQVRLTLHELAGLLAAFSTTTFLVGEYVADDIARYPEFAVVDGIVELLRSPAATRDDRYLRVLKLRGSQYREGLHSFRITPGGLEVFPRLVSPTTPRDFEPTIERVPTGVAGLDRILQGGPWRGSTTIVAGAMGTGKTTIGLQFAVTGIRHGEPSLYLNFQESPQQLARVMRGLGLTEDEIGAIDLLYLSPVEMQIDRIIVEAFRRVEERGLRRIVLDAIGDLSTAVGDQRRLHDFLYAMTQHLSTRGVTTLLTLELPTKIARDSVETARLSGIADVFVLLDVDTEGPLQRSLRVVKARGSAHDLEAHELRISDTGAEVA